MIIAVARVFLIFLVCGMVSGPAQAQRSIEGSRRAWAECQAKQNSSAAFLALSHEIGSGASPDIAFSTDKATPEEAGLLGILLRDYIIPCRQFSLEVARARLPQIIPILEASQARADANYERLIAGQTTWGQFTQSARAIDAELDAELRRYDREPRD